MASERRSVADEPDVPEGIDEASLSVRSPGRFVILDLVTASRRTGRECARNERVRILTEDFNPDRRHAKLLRALPAVVRWLAQKKRCAVNVQADDRPEVPELCGAQRLLVPFGRAARIRDREHDGNDWRLW